MSEGRYAEAYTNREHYENQLREMNKLRQNLNIYDNLLVGQTSRLTQPGASGESFAGLKRSVNQTI